jgi:hypothetical protein
MCIVIFLQFILTGNKSFMNVSSHESNSDSLPSVLVRNRSDLIESKLRHEARLKFAEHRLPETPEEWKEYRVKLKDEIIKKAGVVIDHDLPLNMKETGSVRMKGYTVKNITFQTRPGVYATANLFIPEGKGPFPGVINMLGHWTKGKIDSTGPQGVGHSLAVNKYVCLTIDPWGAGERATKHGVFEYHGANLGASLMNIGESLLGIQVSDNMRGVDLLCSLPFVDDEKIGATGASGGGNQTMWFAALEERVKAAVPVVSVGSFESYIMRSNCICELLIDGLTFTEEAGVLALANAIMPCNHQKDSNPTFFPSEMMRTWENASRIFKMMGKEDHISCRVFDLTHGYMAEDREAMLGWFDYHLKGIGNGQPGKEVPFKQLPEEKLMVFRKGQRDANVISTDEYCRKRGNELRKAFLDTGSFDEKKKKMELHNIVRLSDKTKLKKVYNFTSMNGWDRLAIGTTDNKLVPVMHIAPAMPSAGYAVICNPGGKKNIPLSLIDDWKKKGCGIVIVDLTGTGEASSPLDWPSNKNMILHTLSRAELWLGKTVIGEWIKELDLITTFIKTNYKSDKIVIDGTGEAGLAALFFAALEGDADEIFLRNAPVSYLFDNRESVDYFSMAIHLPGFLNWGDVSLASALSGKNISFISPVTMSGQKISGSKLVDYQAEFDRIRDICGKTGKTFFVY